MREFGEQYKEKQPESNSSSNIRFTTNLFAIDAQFKLVQAYSLLSTLKMSSLKKCVTPPTVKSDDEKLLAVWCSDFLINQEMNDDFHQYFFLREEAKREIDFLDEFLYKPSPPVALIGGTPGSDRLPVAASIYKPVPPQIIGIAPRDIISLIAFSESFLKDATE